MSLSNQCHVEDDSMSTYLLPYRALMEIFLSKGMESNSFLTMNFQVLLQRGIISAIKATWVNFLRNVFEVLSIYKAKMASNNSKVKKGFDMLVWGVEWKVSNFKLTLVVAKILVPSGAQSQIPPKVLLVNDICTHFKCVIQEICTLEMDDALGQLCVNGVLKPEHKHLETKGLTHIPHMPQEFQIKWIRLILSWVHNG